MKRVFLSGIGAIILATLISVIFYSLFLIVSREAATHFQKVKSPVFRQEHTPQPVYRLRDSTGRMITYSPEPMANASNYVQN